MHTFDWKKFWIRIAQIVSVILLNSALIAFLVMNMISYKAVTKTGVEIEISYWDAISSKAVYDIVKEYFKWLPDYHFYNKLIVYVFMVFGAFASFKASVVYYKYNSRYNKEQESTKIDERIYFKKLYAKSQTQLLTKKEKKVLEKLIKKYGAESISNEQ